MCRIFFRRDGWQASKGFDFCSVHQHHLSYLSEEMQFLAAKCTHSSLSFNFSLYFSKLFIKLYPFSFKYFENPFSICVTSESFCLPNKQTCQTPAPRGSFQKAALWTLDKLPSAFMSRKGSVWCVKLSPSRILRKHTKQKRCTLKA